MFVVDGVKVVSMVVVDTEVVLVMGIDDFEADDAIFANDEDVDDNEVLTGLAVVFAVIESVTEVSSPVVFGVDKVTDKFSSFPESDKMFCVLILLGSKNYKFFSIDKLIL